MVSIKLILEVRLVIVMKYDLLDRKFRLKIDGMVFVRIMSSVC